MDSKITTRIFENHGGICECVLVSTEATEDDPCRGHTADLSDEVYNELEVFGECGQFVLEVEVESC